MSPVRIACRANARTSLRRGPRSVDPMGEYDRLPPELRAWLAEAALPWSARSALRVWRRALGASRGDAMAARARLARIERARLEREAVPIWGRAPD
ncbi:DUF6525 family protein [Palleronia sp. LCG004]|uniref:DUF6525 family protein n=1 Tax=Palleronia sp. LCG004 TaxID=3079304 RepID=UPI0029420ABA|nr:DUF6525 family protein [Palleronia sp. LCG004]WOI58451.1 DUF6525 family protein [Palleronia sp. LCG004]